jgi:hypothetical protein
MNTRNKFPFKTMRPYTFIPAALFCALFLYACNFSGSLPDGQNYLTVNFSGTSGTSSANNAHLGPSPSVLSNSHINLLEYKVTFKGPGGTVIEREVEGKSISLPLEAGKWDITADAYDPGGITPMGTGTAEVTVILGQSQSVTIPMTVDPLYEAGLANIFIHNEAELQRIGAAVGGLAINVSTRTFYLENDIVLTEPWTPIGTSTAPFKAKFYGQGHTITINSFSSTAINGQYLGLFGKTDGATIEKLTIVYPDLTVNANPSYDSYVGGLAGQADATTIDNVHVKGVITYTSSSTGNLEIGGLVGIEDTGSSISNSSFSGTLTGEGGMVRAGGIAGQSEATINTSYVAGTITVNPTGSYVSVGGIVGQGTPSILNCYSAVTVMGTGMPAFITRGGGIIGTLTSGSVSKCYALDLVTVAGTTVIYAGGIAGHSYDNIENCAALADVDGGTSTTVGYVIGNNVGTSTPNYVISTATITRNATPDPNIVDGTSFPPSDFQNESTYTGLGWAFGVPGGWKWISGYDYPVLSWQTTAP